MAQGGVFVRDVFYPTRFSKTQYTRFLGNRVELSAPGLAEHDLDAGSQGVDLFKLRDNPRYPD